MTRRPLLILNGKPTRYKHLYITYGSGDRLWYENGGAWLQRVTIDGKLYPIRYSDEHGQTCPTVSYSTRPSGRRMIYVDVPEVE